MNTTLITGASSGIGEVFARKLAARGRNVLLVARSEDKLITLCNELGRSNSIRAQYVALDLSKPESPARLFEEAEKRGLIVDMLINNAGFGSMGEFSKLDLARELNMIDLNVKSLVELTYRFLRPMRDRKQGAIINVASTAGVSAGAVHGDLRRHESVCAFIFRSAVGREPAIRDQGDGALSRVLLRQTFLKPLAVANRPRACRKLRKRSWRRPCAD